MTFFAYFCRAKVGDYIYNVGKHPQKAVLFAPPQGDIARMKHHLTVSNR